MIRNQKPGIRIKAFLLLASLLASGCVFAAAAHAGENAGSLNLDINYPGAGDAPTVTETNNGFRCAK